MNLLINSRVKNQLKKIEIVGVIEPAFNNNDDFSLKLRTNKKLYSILVSPTQKNLLKKHLWKRFKVSGFFVRNNFDNGTILVKSIKLNEPESMLPNELLALPELDPFYSSINLEKTIEPNIEEFA